MHGGRPGGALSGADVGTGERLPIERADVLCRRQGEEVACSPVGFENGCPGDKDGLCSSGIEMCFCGPWRTTFRATVVLTPWRPQSGTSDAMLHMCRFRRPGSCGRLGRIIQPPLEAFAAT